MTHRSRLLDETERHTSIRFYCDLLLIVDVSGSNFAFVIPLSTKIKKIAGYIPIEFKGKLVSLCVHQCKAISQKRILRRIGLMADSVLQEYKNEIKEFYKL